MSRHYPSKILLLGEYAVLAGSSFLALPYHGYSSKWEQGASTDPYLPAILNFLNERNFNFLDLDRLMSDVNHGITLKSNIPIGYGVGSSGSVTAAIYDRYCSHPIHDINLLKERLAEMESFFHGQSSGIDPLVSLLDSSIGLVDGEMSVLPSVDLKGNWFLVDSGFGRSTEKLISVYKEKLKYPAFQFEINKLIEFNSQLFHAVVNGVESAILSSMKSISQLQLLHFKEMIPDHIVAIWEKGLYTDAYYLKLCGAGGGGYFLGYDLGQMDKIANGRIVKLS